VKHLRVVVPNRPGLLAELTEVLAKKNISIEDITVETHGAGAVVRLNVENEELAMEALNDAGYPAVSDAVILARIEDKPGALAELSRELADEQINIRSLHHVRREGGHAFVAISTDDNYRARKLLGEAIV
jgi:hypothetical protein